MVEKRILGNYYTATRHPRDVLDTGPRGCRREGGDEQAAGREQSKAQPLALARGSGWEQANDIQGCGAYSTVPSGIAAYSVFHFLVSPSKTVKTSVARNVVPCI